MTVDLFRVYEQVGADGYPPEWHATIKHLVREQAGHRCLRCHHPFVVGESSHMIRHPDDPDVMINTSTCDEHCRHGGPVVYWTRDVGPVYYDGPDETIAVSVEAVWRILTVHHLNGDKADCRWWNLVALCQRCHLRVQRVVVMQRVWPWTHSDWFKPYAAGWYAHAYLGEDLTREETLARLEELLDLERIA